jgi:hypothetical protein
MTGLFFGVAAFHDVQDLIRRYYGVRSTRAGQRNDAWNAITIMAAMSQRHQSGAGESRRQRIS